MPVPLPARWPRLASVDVERRVRKFLSHAAADAADKEYYASLTPDERLAILFELMARGTDASERRLKRVFRIVNRSEC